jgi:hypothetical protein
MIALIQFNIVLLAVAASIGVVTGWWMFGSRRATAKQPEESDPT